MPMFCRFSRSLTCDKQTDRQTDTRHSIYRDNWNPWATVYILCAVASQNRTDILRLNLSHAHKIAHAILQYPFHFLTK